MNWLLVAILVISLAYSWRCRKEAKRYRAFALSDADTALVDAMEHSYLRVTYEYDESRPWRIRCGHDVIARKSLREAYVAYVAMKASAEIA